MCCRIVKKHNFVKQGLKHGLFLIVANLRQLCASFNAWPSPPGSGAKGNLIKVDFARALVNRVFSTLVSDEEKDRMVSAICKTSVPKVDVEVLEHVSCLDEENCEAVKETIRTATDALQGTLFMLSRGSAEGRSVDSCDPIPFHSNCQRNACVVKIWALVPNKSF